MFLKAKFIDIGCYEKLVYFNSTICVIDKCYWKSLWMNNHSIHKYT